MNKKVMIFTICALIVLIASIFFTSYAAFTATITGTETQSLGNNGYVTLSCSDVNFSITGANIGQKGTYTCALNAKVTGAMNIGYDIALSSVSCSSGATCMISATKNGASILADKNVSTLASSKGTYDTSLTYKIDSGTFNSTGTLNSTTTYVINAWISAVPGNTTSANTSGVCSNTSYTTEAACESANEIWGTSQTVTQGASSFSFKTKLYAKQI